MAASASCMDTVDVVCILSEVFHASLTGSAKVVPSSLVLGKFGQSSLGPFLLDQRPDDPVPDEFLGPGPPGTICIGLVLVQTQSLSWFIS